MRLLRQFITVAAIGSVVGGTALAQTTPTTTFRTVVNIQYGKQITQKQAKTIALLRYPGRVVGSVKTMNAQSRKCYVVDVLYLRKTHRLAIDVENRRILSDVVIKTDAIKIPNQHKKFPDKKHWKLTKSSKPKIRDHSDKIKAQVKKHEDKPKVKKHEDKDKKKPTKSSGKKGKGAWVK